MQTNLYKSHLESKLPNCTFISEYYTKTSHHGVTCVMYVHLLISSSTEKVVFHDLNDSIFHRII